MPLQNRVDPFGNIIRTPARGTMLGNRGGALHNSDKEIVRAYKSRRWITCVLEFRGRHRVVMSENRYTELFFLDEAVAFAAGHRPCAECRRARYEAFKDAWRRTHHQNKSPLADEWTWSYTRPESIREGKRSHTRESWVQYRMVALCNWTGARSWSGTTQCCFGRPRAMPAARAGNGI